MSVRCPRRCAESQGAAKSSRLWVDSFLTKVTALEAVPAIATITGLKQRASGSGPLLCRLFCERVDDRLACR